MKNKLKRLLTFFLALLCITCATPSTVFASDHSYEIKQLTALSVLGNSGTAMTDYDRLILPSSTNVRDGICSAKGDAIYIQFASPADIPKNSSLTFNVGVYEDSRYKDFSNILLAYGGLDIDANGHIKVDSYKWNRATGSLVLNFVNRSVISKGTDIELMFDAVYLDTFNRNTTPYFKIDSVSIDVDDEKTGKTYAFFDKVTSFFSDLFGRLTEWFNTLFQWLKDIRDGNVSFSESVKTLFSNITKSISEFFSELGKKLTDGFSNLTSSISTFFSNLTKNLKTWFENIGSWFVDLGDNIAGFFEKLWNRIWWGNENGESEYQKPVINNKLTDILATLNDYQQKLKDTIDTIGSSADEISTYITTGTQLVNGVINVAGGGITALIVFGMVFILVRKVVGR